jgi:hypothetical protein
MGGIHARLSAGPACTPAGSWQHSTRLWLACIAGCSSGLIGMHTRNSFAPAHNSMKLFSCIISMADRLLLMVLKLLVLCTYVGVIMWYVLLMRNQLLCTAAKLHLMLQSSSACICGDVSLLSMQGPGPAD